MDKFIRNNCRLPVESTLLPLVVPCGKRQSFFWKSRWGYIPLGHLETPHLRFLKHDGSLPGGGTAHWGEYTPLPCAVCPDGSITFEAEFPDEGRYNFELFCGDTLAASAQVFAAAEDLFVLTPFKGDFHTHSSNSDGRQNGAFVALLSRRQGMDFTTITDHRSYCSPDEAERFANESGTGILVLPGEEVHLPCAPGYGFKSDFPWFNTRWVKDRSPVHIINAGGTGSVNELADNGLESFTKEIFGRCEKLPRALSDEDKWNIASTEWAFEKIREFDGLAVFPHPCWMVSGRQAVSDRVRNALAADCKFDAMETVNGGFGEESLMNTALFHSINVAPVSGSDRHDFSKNDPLPFTIVFAEQLTRGAIVDAVRRKMCCSATPIPNQKLPILTGDIRLVNYALFLFENYFPCHDKSCERECLLHPAFGWEPDKNLQEKAATETAKWRSSAFASNHR